MPVAVIGPMITNPNASPESSLIGTPAATTNSLIVAAITRYMRTPNSPHRCRAPNSQANAAAINYQTGFETVEGFTVPTPIPSVGTYNGWYRLDAHEKSLGEAWSDQHGPVTGKDGTEAPRLRVKVVDKDSMTTISRAE